MVDVLDGHAECDHVASDDTGAIGCDVAKPLTIIRFIGVLRGALANLREFGIQKFAWTSS